ncbi:response regulator [Breoghania sp.]|uniref:response regulator n=1 Tax=Breoghania sp. TaxID=2065378 RepID=UPI002AA82E5C|nr:response regulator [Breoghania sp.]
MTISEHSIRSVLIVAPANSFTQLLEQMLPGIGTTASTTIDDVEAAHHWLRKNSVDAILVDAALAKAGAATFAREVRADITLENRCTPLVLLSGSGAPALMQQALKAGFDTVLPKPLPRQHLKEEFGRLSRNTRVYIRAPSGYCGPDRRRRTTSPATLPSGDGKDRRENGSFQIQTADGPIRLEQLRALHRGPDEKANMAVLLIRGNKVVDGYRLHSDQLAARKAG